MNEVNFRIDMNAVLDHERREHELEIARLNGEIKKLQTALEYEKNLRAEAEIKIGNLEEKLLNSGKRIRRTKAEIAEDKKNRCQEYSEVKKNGVKKATKTEPIKSYTDFKKIQDYFLERNQIRNYTLWTVGVCLGVRVSDLCDIKWKNIINEDGTFRKNIMMYEQKTSKLQNCLITEAIKKAFGKLLDSKDYEFDPEEYIFQGNDKSFHLDVKQVYKILNKAVKETGIDCNIGTHTMRRSFANIVHCVDKNVIDMNALTKVQGLLNHSDVRTTMRYLGTLDDMYNKARKVVSDFCLGKTDIDELVCGEGYSASDVMVKLSQIEEKISHMNC